MSPTRRPIPATPIRCRTRACLTRCRTRARRATDRRRGIAAAAAAAGRDRADVPEVGDETGECLIAILGAEDGRRVDRRDDELRQAGPGHLAAFRVTRKPLPSSVWAAVAPRSTSARGCTSSSSASSQGLHASCSLQLGLSWMRRVAPRLPLEVLDGVRHVDVVAIDPGGLEGTVEDASGRADERTALPVLLVSRLLAHQHDVRRGASLAEHRLGRVPVQRAGGAALHRSPHHREVRRRARNFASLCSLAPVMQFPATRGRETDVCAERSR